VESLVRGGEGLVRDPEGRIFFVPFVAPEDDVEVMPRGKTEATLEKILARSPLRITPACDWFARCGGCPMMMIDLETQRTHHVKTLKRDLEHALGPNFPSIEVHPAASALRYRSRARLHFAVKSGRVTLGYLAHRSRDIVDIASCVALDPVLDRARGEIARLLAVRGLSIAGEAHLALREERDGVRAVATVSFDGDFNAELVANLAGAVGERFAGIELIPRGASQGARYGDPRPCQIGADGEPILLPPGGFAQSSSEGAKRLAILVRSLAQTEARRVVELYAGSGTLSILLARDAASFTAIESDKGSADALRANLDARSLKAKVIHADVAGAALPKCDVIVLDPPRRGAREALSVIAKTHAKTIVYVSCDGASLARDLKELAASRYQLTQLHIVELFPNTSHVEVVARLERQ
jgi:23S rRNA (uracil1939-C5)-methyltransferase